MTDQRRRKLAALPFAEKLKILDKLREASRQVASAGLRKKVEPPAHNIRSKSS
jgi:hypothetical protein